MRNEKDFIVSLGMLLSPDMFCTLHRRRECHDQERQQPLIIVNRVIQENSGGNEDKHSETMT